MPRFGLESIVPQNLTNIAVTPRLDFALLPIRRVRKRCDTICFMQVALAYDWLLVSITLHGRIVVSTLRDGFLFFFVLRYTYFYALLFTYLFRLRTLVFVKRLC